MRELVSFSVIPAHFLLRTITEPAIPTFIWQERPLTHHTAKFEIHVNLQQLKSQKDSEEECKDERC